MYTHIRSGQWDTSSGKRTYSEQTQGNASASDKNERICTEAYDNHSEDKLDEAQGYEAFGIDRYMLATSRAMG